MLDTANGHTAFDAQNELAVIGCLRAVERAATTPPAK